MDAQELCWRDYDATLRAYAALADTRFKLLAFLPTISGIAVGTMTSNLAEFKATPLPRFVIGVMGFIVTLGIAFYDQRNSQLYNALSRRAGLLEKKLGLEVPGQFSSRPGRTLRFVGLVPIWHDRALAFIYGTVLGAWVFPVACGALWLADASSWLPVTVPTASALIALIATVASITEIHRLDRQASKSSAAGVA